MKKLQQFVGTMIYTTVTENPLIPSSGSVQILEILLGMCWDDHT